ncbi:hypothetical protein [Pseudoalteromonas sp. HF66]|uniref:hypothetical protein n=1 Tax=Pseudoalteromonas sp. HF66 TaxID=2721559 RepID=UPI00143065E1|nr:hypothetical protein [Pseudoalteromonas sp. HF66]NIZ06471.1 hypothetical protein [Pseudoalteromonas sp. HF66]
MELSITFACKTCGEEVEIIHIVDEFNAPLPGSNDLGEDLISNDCNRCGENKNIIVNYDANSASFFVENNTALLVTDDDYILERAHINAIFSLNELQDADVNYTDFLGRLFFTHSITILEAYLSDLFKFYINSNFSCFLNFIESSKELKSERFTLVEFLTNKNLPIKKVNTRLDELLFHNLGVVSALFEGVFNLKFNDVIGKENRSSLEKLICYRHDCIHRNGRTKNGSSIFTDKDINMKIFQEMKTTIHNIHQAVLGLEIEINKKQRNLWNYMDNE